MRHQRQNTKQRLVLVDAAHILPAQPRPKPVPFQVSRTLVEQEIGFTLSKEAGVGHFYEDKILLQMLAVVNRWSKKKHKRGTAPDVADAVANFYKDKRLTQRLRALVERKAAGVVSGKIRFFVPIHPDDPVQPIILEILGRSDTLFTPEELAVIMKDKTFMLCWVGKPPTPKHTGMFAVLTGGKSG